MQNVKSTMIDELLDHFAPHYCCSCGEIGSILCESCKYDITENDTFACLLCGYVADSSGVCGTCRPIVQRAWYVGERTGALEVLINRYKFGRARAGFQALGDLLLARLPVLPPDTIVVPIPTARPHIRRRGYDHALLLAEYVAKRRHLTLRCCLERRTSTEQRGASREIRQEQAKAAFQVRGPLEAAAPCLIIDDVVTTGATVRYAAAVLRSAGAETVFIAAVARQPLELAVPGQEMIE